MQTPAHHRIGCEGAIQVTTGDTPILAELDKPKTFKEAAVALGVPYHVVQRAARRPRPELPHRFVAPLRQVAGLHQPDGAQRKQLTGE
jgi:hypothetical protein